MIVLSLNCGSSSAKYRLYDYDKKVTLATGIVERVGIGKSFIQQAGLGRAPIQIDHDCANHKDALKLIIDTLLDPKVGVLDDLKKISAVGHRVVHGGEKFKKSVIIDAASLETFKALYSLAPLHNPPNVLGIEAAMDVLPSIPHMAIMDTAWHQTMPAHVYMYALPYEWYEKYSVRRYGFHGTSFLYVAKRAALLLGKDPFISATASRPTPSRTAYRMTPRWA
jgi:acetate kinase